MGQVKQYRFKVWIKQAEFDLAAARLSLGNGYYEWAAFQSEQSAEKALKGIMAYCGDKPPKMHKLSILLKMARKLQPEFNREQLRLDTLQTYTFVSRYPFIIPGDNLTPHEFMTDADAQECIHEAESVLLFAKKVTNFTSYDKNHSYQFIQTEDTGAFAGDNR